MSNNTGGMIVEKLAMVAEEITHIGKDQKNQGQGFKFRGIDQCLNALHGPFAKHEIVIGSEILDHKVFERTTKSGGIQYHHMMKVRYIFTHADGSSLSFEAPGESLDSGDKGMAKCMSIALKTTLFQMLTIPVEEQSIEDPDRHSPEESVPAPVTDEQKYQIEQLVDRLQFEDSRIQNMYKWAGASDINSLTEKSATRIIRQLETEEQKLKKNG